jgi:hypothetical protein
MGDYEHADWRDFVWAWTDFKIKRFQMHGISKLTCLDISKYCSRNVYYGYCEDCGSVCAAEPNRPQYDRPAACVIALHYSSSTFASSSIPSRNNRCYFFKKMLLFKLFYFFENCVNLKLLNLTLRKSWIVCNRLESVWVDSNQQCSR